MRISQLEQETENAPMLTTREAHKGENVTLMNNSVTQHTIKSKQTVARNFGIARSNQMIKEILSLSLLVTFYFNRGVTLRNITQHNNTIHHNTALVFTNLAIIDNTSVQHHLNKQAIMCGAL